MCVHACDIMAGWRWSSFRERRNHQNSKRKNIVKEEEYDNYVIMPRQIKDGPTQKRRDANEQVPYGTLQRQLFADFFFPKRIGINYSCDQVVYAHHATKAKREDNHRSQAGPKIKAQQSNDRQNL